MTFKKMFKILTAVTSILMFAFLVRLTILGNKSKSGQAHGLVSGMLARCPDKPNCVSSEFTNDTSHYIEPINYSGNESKKAWNAVLQIIRENGGTVSVASDEYIAAAFSVSLFGFIDDLECRLDTVNHRIHLRSASRVGHNDLGVNKKRVATISRLFKQEFE